MKKQKDISRVSAKATDKKGSFLRDHGLSAAYGAGLATVCVGALVGATAIAGVLEWVTNATAAGAPPMAEALASLLGVSVMVGSVLSGSKYVENKIGKKIGKKRATTATLAGLATVGLSIGLPLWYAIKQAPVVPGKPVKNSFNATAPRKTPGLVNLDAPRITTPRQTAPQKPPSP